MMKSVFEILDRFIAGKPLAAGQLSLLKELFATEDGRRTADSWLAMKWEQASGQDREIGYEALREKIMHHEGSLIATRKNSSKRIFVRRFQRIAAVLLLPLAVLSVLLAVGSFDEVKTYTAEAPWGEKARIVLPDGSTVMLNAGSRISYTSDFDRRNRRLELDGEAYFEVQRHRGKSFVVNTPYLDVEVTGTRFNVNAYADEPSVVASLIEGSVTVTTHEGSLSYELTPGNSLAFAKVSGEVSFPVLNDAVVLAWKDNRLVFADDDIASLAKKIERWYDVRVAYDAGEFGDSRFTVRLREGEQLDNLLDIIETALDAECTIRNDTLYITRQK